jgi:Intracellular proteinase inhibitor
MMNRWAAVVACVASCACDTATRPSDEDALRLTVQISSTTVARGQVLTMTFRLENVGSETVNLTFNSGCTILPYIRERSTNRIVYPQGGDWMCTAVLTQISLRPGAVELREVRVRAPDTPGTADAVLPPGDYQTFARLDDTRFRLESDPVSFVIQ